MPLSILLGCLVFLFLVWMIWIEPQWRRITRVRATIRKPLARPFKVLHLSDTHFSGGDGALSRFFDQLAAEEVDFVFVTGDVIDCDKGIGSCLENLKKLKPLLGTYVVFGNHDYYNFRLLDVFMHNFPGQARPYLSNSTALFKASLEEKGIHVLSNETAELAIDGTPVLIHGLDDATTGRADLLKAMASFDRAKINILLTHTIDVFIDLGENQIDLSFSGHSHGGQIRLPFIGPLITHTSLGRRYAAGLFDLKGAVCSVSRGLNASRYLRARLLCRPEAILLTVRGC